MPMVSVDYQSSSFLSQLLSSMSLQKASSSCHSRSSRHHRLCSPAAALQLAGHQPQLPVGAAVQRCSCRRVVPPVCAAYANVPGDDEGKDEGHMIHLPPAHHGSNPSLHMDEHHGSRREKTLDGELWACTCLRDQHEASVWRSWQWRCCRQHG